MKKNDIHFETTAGDIPVCNVDRSKYFLHEIKEGGAAFYPEEDDNKRSRMHGIISTLCHRRKQRYGQHYITRTVAIDGVKGIKVWRLK